MKQLAIIALSLFCCAPAHAQLPPLPSTSRICKGSRIACGTHLGPALTPSQQAVRDRLIRNTKAYNSRWRKYGVYEVDWHSWKLHSNGTRSAQLRNSFFKERIGIDCVGTRVANGRRDVRGAITWGEWGLPSVDSDEARILIDICSSAK